ncbi:MAG: hypothetical protein NTY08_18845 [Proteobacteria bacterium]|nr:hypothetical protein [Pseudomonadota bacterium]
MNYFKCQFRLAFLTSGLILLFSDHLIASAGNIGEFRRVMNANVASDYVASSMPMATPGCPLVGFLRLLPGGDLKGILITDMARSQARVFSGKYQISNGGAISFTSNDAQVPLANISGALSFTTVIDSANPPIDRLTLKTATKECADGTYKFSLYVDDE